MEKKEGRRKNPLRHAALGGMALLGALFAASEKAYAQSGYYSSPQQMVHVIEESCVYEPYDNTEYCTITTYFMPAPRERTRARYRNAYTPASQSGYYPSHQPHYDDRQESVYGIDADYYPPPQKPFRDKQFAYDDDHDESGREHRGHAHSEGRGERRGSFLGGLFGEFLGGLAHGAGEAVAQRVIGGGEH